MNIAWLIIITFLVVALQSYLYSKWGLEKVFYNRSFSEKAVVEGETIEMVDEIVNKKLLPLPWLRLESKISKHLEFRTEAKSDHNIDHGGFHRSLFSLMPYQRVRRRQILTCRKRGHYRFETVELSTGDVFGFGETFKSVPSVAEITVYPKLIPVEDIPLPSHSWLGDLVVRRWIIEDPFMMAGTRDYVSGDPLHNVHWKATARMNRLQVIKKDYTADHHLMIYVNFNQTGDIWYPVADEELVEKSLSYAASIAHYSITNGISTGFGCNSYIGENKKETINIEPRNSKQHLTYLFETMAKVAVDSNKSIEFFLQEDIERQVSGIDFLIITAIVTDTMKQRIKTLESFGNAVELLVLESEEVKKRQKVI